MDVAVTGQFRMEGRGEYAALADQDRLTPIARENFNPGPDPDDSRRANKHTLVRRRFERCFE